MVAVLAHRKAHVHWSQQFYFLTVQVWDQKYKTDQAAHFMNLLRLDVMVRPCSASRKILVLGSHEDTM